MARGFRTCSILRHFQLLPVVAILIWPVDSAGNPTYLPHQAAWIPHSSASEKNEDDNSGQTEPAISESFVGQIVESRSLINFTKNGYENWKAYDLTDPPDFWQRTRENIKEAGVVKFWTDFAHDYDTTDSFGCKSHKKPLGYISCFTEVYLGNPNFQCNIDGPWLCTSYDAQQVMDRVNRRFENETPEEKVDRGRAAFFTLELLQLALKYQNREYQLVSVIHAQAVASAEALVETFTPQVDKKALAKCELEKSLIKLFVMLAIDCAAAVGSMILSSLLPAIAEAVQAAEGTVNTAVNTALKEGEAVAQTAEKEVQPAVQELSHIGGTVTRATLQKDKKRVIETFKKNLKDQYPTTLLTIANYMTDAGINGGEDGHNYHKIDHQSDTNDDPDLAEAERLSLVMTTANGKCGNDYGVVEDDNKQHTANLKEYINKYSTKIRGSMSVAFNSGFIYNETTFANSSLPAFESLASLDQLEDFSASYKELEKNAVRSFKYFLASSLLSQTRSIMVCEEHEASEMEGLCHEKTSLPTNSSRYCPPNTNYRCQIERLTKQAHNNHMDFVPGLNDGSWENFNVTPQALMEGSWKYRQRNRALIPQEMLQDGHLIKTDQTLHIPVCTTRVKTIGNMDVNIKRKPHHFVFACGDDYRGNETEKVFQETNIHPLEEHDVWFRMIPQFLAREHDPIVSYFTISRWKLRWPSKSIPHLDALDWLVHNETDIHYEQVLHETALMDRDEANYHFCNMPAMQRIFKEDHPHLINVLPPPLSHKRKCKRWKADHKNNIADIARRSRDKFQWTCNMLREVNSTLVDSWPQTMDEEDKRLSDMRAAAEQKRKDAEERRNNKVLDWFSLLFGLNS